MSTPTLTAAEWLARTKEAERRGELLAAYDTANQGLAEHPSDLWLEHRAVLALARSGATRQAAARYAEFGLDRASHEEDVAALAARIAKDRALAANGAERARLAAAAAARYAAIHTRNASYYPAINAATLWLVANEPAKSRELANQAMALAERGAAKNREDAYYRHATAAEAALLATDATAAGRHLRAAADLKLGDFAALATTRRQLRLVCELQGIDPAVLAILASPAVVHFCGHMMAAAGARGRLEADSETRVAGEARRVLADADVGFGYGSLASGADILWAEALLERQAELHVVLPFAREDFVRLSVAPAGADWVGRFERCLERATSITYATEDRHLGDDTLFSYAAQLAMGLALLRARYLDTPVEQMAIWDGGPPGGVSGTTVDIEFWRKTSRRTTIVPSGGTLAPVAKPPIDITGRRRIPRAMLFGDVKGFSKLNETEMPAFVERLLGTLAGALDGHRRHILFRNTWGDGIFVVLDDAVAAAGCALDLQAAMIGFDLAAAELPAHLGLRLGGHVGPVYEMRDPLLDRSNFFGAHVSRTARIEPITPVGEVYVTEMFAATLALGRDLPMTCDYVGHMPAAKGYGNLRMYLLRRSG